MENIDSFNSLFHFYEETPRRELASELERCP